MLKPSKRASENFFLIIKSFSWNEILNSFRKRAWMKMRYLLVLKRSLLSLSKTSDWSHFSYLKLISLSQCMILRRKSIVRCGIFFHEQMRSLSRLVHQKYRLFRISLAPTFVPFIREVSRKENSSDFLHFNK